MKKFLVVFLGLFSLLSVNAFALSPDYENATYYVQLSNTSRLVAKSGSNWGYSPIYFHFLGNDVYVTSTANDLCVLQEDGSYNSLSIDYLPRWNDGKTEWPIAYRLRYPFTLGGKQITSRSSFNSAFTGNGVYVLEQGYSSVAENRVPFFRKPLLEAVKEQQKGTTNLATIVVSYLGFLVPFGIGLMALLVSLPLLRKVFPTFLR